MKKYGSIAFRIFLFVVVLTFSLVITVNAEEKPITLTLAEYTNPNSLTGKGLVILQEEITKNTNGKVELKIFWAESLLTGKEILQGVENGVVDIGNVNPSYFPNQLSINGVFAVIPRGPIGYKYQIMVYKKVMEQVPAWRDQFLAHNNLPLYIFALGDKAICSTKPLASLEDFKNKKMRASSKWQLGLLSAAGAVPVSLPWSDCYMGLQTGTIDAVLSNFDAIHSDKFDEVAPHILLVKGLWSKPPVFYTFNKDVWNNLSKDIQGQIMEAFETTAARYGEVYDEIWDSSLKGAEEIGSIVNSMSAEDTEKWLTLPEVVEMQEQWVEEVEKTGLENARELLEQIKSIVEEVRVREIEEMNN
ncbi:MAG: TRAP transporter substrate-binding protein DctP [Atribacterota bacterium]|nr:TRAP transporter substrate-binding protein DctP [Atribacterota bacterium]